MATHLKGDGHHDLLERMRAALQREAVGTVIVVGQSQLGLEAVESFVEHLDTVEYVRGS